MIISVKEARKILGKVASGMTDEQITETIETLDIIAKDSLQQARDRLKMNRDANEMAHLIYDIYQDKKRLEGTQGLDSSL